MDRKKAIDQMIERDLEGRGIRKPEVLAAMRAVPRDAFVSDQLYPQAFADRPLPIGEGQTISQPYIVAYMVEALDLHGGERVLEIGSGSGYAAAVLGEIAREVYGVERFDSLAERSRETLAEIGATNVTIKAGDGTKGWPEHAPYDAILVSAGGAEVPPALIEQLAEGGRLVMPVGGFAAQELVRLEKMGNGTVKATDLGGARFVPLVSADESKDRK